ncbi:iron-sulfur cluster insertion protein ErpA [Candidatus Williamhamiltonella defendens]|uniref:Iron-sulfur cluster insertion protein ErpA n=3 Tax=Candidatus Williamhamiltonella defendens TaxID=138072 RepID=ERPA_HAMD5|nr:iron-sulfur cluster insertion protein ErpA [Candidatus Hamiltonella defensa]C4K3H0.1 RecName: Full=Iron-sulfur cluster insertion protein ErpA [Candidatus Hamiltonella defensa 5AT (Acyrthosiphon pisum)]ACQ67113.1 hypothetical protein HDEF_0354 [Candidatus Hamiltonella defensa 5AT (Acyrthosiphon pisum)]ASV33795.1 iron-sulfur cluster insertion protein ErpA [Candidatus Hamiltonella defensa]ASX26411.1 iron-sulfur cluster insertion protein ErpA [Candidatus Hamiltonella defensa (Bemisia tabaci)]AT
MNHPTRLPLDFTEAAARKFKELIANEHNSNKKLRVYVEGGGCNGFKYMFTLDDKVNEGDLAINKQGVSLVVDPLSLGYLIGGIVDYVESIEYSRFIVKNLNAKTTCGCGSSFSV